MSRSKHKNHQDEHRFEGDREYGAGKGKGPKKHIRRSKERKLKRMTLDQGS